MPDTAAPLVLALDPTHHRNEWVALVISVVYREHTIPVAWHVVVAQVRGSGLLGGPLQPPAAAAPSDASNQYGSGAAATTFGGPAAWLLPSSTISYRLRRM